MPGRHKDSYAIQTVENALYVLEAISKEPEDFGVTYLSGKLAMSKSYVYRMLATFEKSGYVQSIKGTGRYCAGLMAYQMGSRFLHQMQLSQKAKPFMESLAKESGEAVYLALASGRDALFFDFVDSPQQVRVMPLAGRSFPKDRNSAGRVIEAYNSDEAKMSSSQKVTKQKGYFVEKGMIGEGIGSLAVPVINRQQFACASLCMVAPDFRFNQDRIEQSLVPMLVSVGKQLSAQLGHFKDNFYDKCG